MITRLSHLWKTQRLAVVAFLAAAGLVCFFGVNALAAAIYWMDPRHQDQPLAGWMTPRYVAQSYDLPPDAIQDALFITRGETPRGISLLKLAEANDTTLADLQARVTAAAEAHRAEGGHD